MRYKIPKFQKGVNVKVKPPNSEKWRNGKVVKNENGNIYVCSFEFTCYCSRKMCLFSQVKGYQVGPKGSFWFQCENCDEIKLSLENETDYKSDADDEDDEDSDLSTGPKVKMENLDSDSDSDSEVEATNLTRWSFHSLFEFLTFVVVLILDRGSFKYCLKKAKEIIS